MENENSFSYCQIDKCTDVGRKRKANEDSMGTFETVNGLVLVVCDGMGGHVGGEMASRIAVDTIHAYMNRKFVDDPREAIGFAIEEANKAILGYAQKHTELEGMGSTCVLVLVRDAKVYIGHVGDSRIYLIRDRKIKQLTKDHSFVQTLVDEGLLAPEEAEHHPRKNEITNALGIVDMKPATVRPEPITPEEGDCFLLCSDGLSGMVSDKEIERIISRQFGNNVHGCAKALVNRANEQGGLDNVTVQLVKFLFRKEKPHKRGWLKIGLPFVLLCALVICTFLYLTPHFQKSQSPQEKVQAIETQTTVEDTEEVPTEINMVSPIEETTVYINIQEENTQIRNQDFREVFSKRNALMPINKEISRETSESEDKNESENEDKIEAIGIAFKYELKSAIYFYPDGKIIIVDSIGRLEYPDKFNWTDIEEVNTNCFSKESFDNDGLSFVFKGKGHPKEQVRLRLLGEGNKQVYINLIEKK